MAIGKTVGQTIQVVQDINRLRQIVNILVRHGLADMVRRLGLEKHLPGGVSAEGEKLSEIDLPKRIRLVIQDLGTTYIKFGQVLSIRPDLLPREFIDQLKHLQDSITPVPVEEVKQLIERELGAPVEELFSEFDEKPLATASIGQVHEARTKEGDRVGVKIQRPGIKPVIEADLSLMYFFARQVEKQIPELDLYHPEDVVREFDKAIHRELDFQVEAAHAERFRSNMAEFDFVKVPRVYGDLSKTKVLTLEFCEGVKADRFAEVGLDGPAMARKGLQMVYKMVFEDGFFHADPHPGNLFVTGEGRIVLLDLGLVGKLTEEQRDNAVDLTLAMLSKDYETIADMLLLMGRPREKVDRGLMAGECEDILEKYWAKPLKEIQIGNLIRDVLQRAQMFQIEVPADYILAGKALMTIEGLAKEIHPDMDIVKEAAPFVSRALKRRYDPKKLLLKNLRKARMLAQEFYQLPGLLGDALRALEEKKLEVATRNEGLERLPGAISRGSRRIALAVVTAALLVVSTALLFTEKTDPADWPPVVWIGFLCALASGALLLLALRDNGDGGG